MLFLMSKPPYVDPLIPLQENSAAELTRLSLNITTLTHLIEDADHQGRVFLTTLFTRARNSKVAQARACVARSHPEHDHTG